MWYSEQFHLFLKKLQVLVTWNSCWNLFAAIGTMMLTGNHIGWEETSTFYIQKLLSTLRKAVLTIKRIYVKAINHWLTSSLVMQFFAAGNKERLNVFTMNWSTKTVPRLFLTWKTTSKSKSKCLLTTKTVTHGWIKSSLTFRSRILLIWTYNRSV